MSETAVAVKESKFDDVMLAMDIVDTLRHRERIIDQELSAEEREAKLIERLREIYAAQGIEVPDRILRDGVKALEDKRFVYEPKAGGFQRKLANIYIARDRWLKPVALITGAAAFLTASYEFGFEAPRRAAAERTQIELTQTLPADLERARDEALALAQTDPARRRIETAYQNGLAAADAGDAAQSRENAETLEKFSALLGRDLEIRVVSRPGEMSGIFRIPNDAPNARNYYLIVEGVDASGAAQAFEIMSEENRTAKWVTSWGVRVPQGEYNRIAADKQDDQIIQNAVVGAKPKGALAPTYSVETAGGEIVEW